jgi:homogentisate 1,2-dioxygenase
VANKQTEALVFGLMSNMQQGRVTVHTYIQTHSIDPSSIQDGMNVKLVTKKKKKQTKERRGR